MGKVSQLGFAPFVEAYYFLNKGLVITLESLTILLQIENGSALRFHLIDVEVVDASDLVTGLGTLNTFFLLSVSLLGGLLRHLLDHFLGLMTTCRQQACDQACPVLACQPKGQLLAGP